MFFRIKALDTLFFRNGTPFTAGSDYFAESLFPPLPSVYRGAMRTCYFTHHPDELDKAGEEGDPTGNAEIGFTCIKKEDEAETLWFPLPMDMGFRKTSDGVFLQSTELRPIENVSSYPLKYVLKAPESKKLKQKERSFWIKKGSLEAYLNGDDGHFPFCGISDFVAVEHKTGIMIDSSTNTVKEGMFYQIPLSRPLPGISLIVEVNGLELPEQALIKLGGESKAAVLLKESSSNISSFSINVEEAGERCFKLYFSSPAIFHKGWIPDWLEKNENNFEGIFTNEERSVTLRLLAASTGRAVGVGGFDMKKRRPKKMQYAVPAGSVYYFELLKGTFADVLKLFHQKCISDSLSEEGFGYCFVGKIRGGIPRV